MQSENGRTFEWQISLAKCELISGHFVMKWLHTPLRLGKLVSGGCFILASLLSACHSQQRWCPSFCPPFFFFFFLLFFVSGPDAYSSPFFFIPGFPSRWHAPLSEPSRSIRFNNIRPFIYRLPVLINGPLFPLTLSTCSAGEEQPLYIFLYIYIYYYYYWIRIIIFLNFFLYERLLSEAPTFNFLTKTTLI